MPAKLKNNTALGESLWFSALWLQFFFILCITMPFNQGLAHRLIEFAMVLSIELCCVKLLLEDKLSTKELWFTAAALALCTASAWIARQRPFLGLMALVMSCRRISFRKILQHYALFCIGYIVLTLLLFAAGYLHTNTLSIRYTIGPLKIWSNDLGFTHYNYAAMWFFLAALCIAVIVPPKYRTCASLLGICLMSIVFCITASRTAFALSLWVFGALIFQRRHPTAPGKCRNFRIFSALLILGMVSAMFLLSYLFNAENPIYVLANKLVSCRLAFSQFYLKPEMLFLLGNPSRMPGPVLDFMYLNIAYRFGIAAMLLYIGLQVYAADRCIRAGRLDYWILAVTLAAYSLYENSLHSCIMMMLYPAFAMLEKQDTDIR